MTTSTISLMVFIFEHCLAVGRLFSAGDAQIRGGDVVREWDYCRSVYFGASITSRLSVFNSEHRLAVDALRLRGTLKVSALKTPGFGERKSQYLHDIAFGLLRRCSSLGRGNAWSSSAE